MPLGSQRLQRAPETAPLSGAVVARHAWPDVARGLTVLLVVAMHVLYLHSVPLLWGTPATSAHQPISDATNELRMPLFFLVSGFLSAGMLQRSWRAGISGRIAPRYYLYLVWLVITSLVLWWLASADGVAFDAFDYVVSQLWEPGGILWYIWALALFFLVARATRAVPVWILLIPAAAASVLGQANYVGLWSDAAVGFVPFLIGARLPDLIVALTDRVPLRIGLPVLGTGLAMAIVHSVLDPPRATGIIVSIVFVPGVLLVLPHVAHWRLFRPIRHVGRNTLPIFAMHPLLIAIASRAAMSSPELLAFLDAHPWAAALWPPVVLLAIVLTSLWLHRLLRAIGLRHLFEMPRWRALRRAVRISRA